MHGADAHIRTSKLAERVENWQTRMEPILAAEEAREERAAKPSQLEASILSSCCALLGVPIGGGDSSPPLTQSQGSTGAGGGPTTTSSTAIPTHQPLDFKRILQKNGSTALQDIPRMFLAVLQLANNGNVDIHTTLPVAAAANTTAAGKNKNNSATTTTTTTTTRCPSSRPAAAQPPHITTSTLKASETRHNKGEEEEEEEEEGSGWILSQDIPYSSQDAVMEEASMAAALAARKREMRLSENWKSGGSHSTANRVSSLLYANTPPHSFCVSLLSTAVRKYEHPEEEEQETEGGATHTAKQEATRLLKQPHRAVVLSSAGSKGESGGAELPISSPLAKKKRPGLTLGKISSANVQSESRPACGAANDALDGRNAFGFEGGKAGEKIAARRASSRGK